MANIICGEYLRNYAAKTRNQRLICVSHLISTFIFQLCFLFFPPFIHLKTLHHSIIKHLIKNTATLIIHVPQYLLYPAASPSSLSTPIRRRILNTQQWLFLGSLIETFEDFTDLRHSLANPLFALSFNFESRLRGLQKYFSSHCPLLPRLFAPSSSHTVKRSVVVETGLKRRLQSFIINGAPLCSLSGSVDRDAREGEEKQKQEDDFIKSKGKHSAIRDRVFARPTFSTC